MIKHATKRIVSFLFVVLLSTHPAWVITQSIEQPLKIQGASGTPFILTPYNFKTISPEDPFVKTSRFYQIDDSDVSGELRNFRIHYAFWQAAYGLTFALGKLTFIPCQIILPLR